MSHSNSSMMGMLFIMADIMSTDEVISNVEKAIADYKEGKLLNKSAEEMEKLSAHIAFHCMMLMHKLSKCSAIENLEEMDKISRLRDMIKPAQG